MKKSMQKLISLCLMIVLAISLSTSVFASSAEVSFSGTKKTFTFSPDSHLFENLQELMPGDTKSQQIAVKVAFAAKTKQVKISLKAIPEDAAMKAYLKQLSMKVTQPSTGKVLFEGNPDLTSNNGVLLGTFTKAGTATLKIDLTVPTSLGNDTANLSGDIKWQLIAEVLEDETGGGGNGGGGGGGGGGNDPEPTPTPTQTPAATPEPEVTQPITPEEILPPEDIPKADFTEEPDKGAWALVNLLCSIGSIAFGAAQTYSFFKRKNEITDEDELKKLKSKLFGWAPAALSVLTFFLTEKISGQMVMADKWTLLMVLFPAANGALSYFTRTQTPGVTEE